MWWRSRPPRDLQLACPKCQQRFPAGEVVFLCPEPRCLGREHPLPGQPPEWENKPLFRPARYDYAVTCPHSPHTAYLKICPRCWIPLPLASGRSSTVAIVGASAAGKTCFMTALVRQIRRHLARKNSVEMSLEWDDDAGRQYFREQERTIFHECLLPAATQKEAPLESLQITIRFPIRRLLSRLLRGGQGAVSLVFPDPAGDFFERLEDVYYLNYLSHAQAIILMVDPMMSEEYRQYLKAQGKEPPLYMGTSAADALRTFVKALRREAKREEGKLDKELAVVLAKCDEDGMFDPDDRQYADQFPRQGRNYDARIAREVSEQVTQHMQDFLGLDEVVTLAQQSFKKVCFFAASALGTPPVTTRENGTVLTRLRDPAPRRVEEPLLWILHEWGYL